AGDHRDGRRRDQGTGGRAESRRAARRSRPTRGGAGPGRHRRRPGHAPADHLRVVRRRPHPSRADPRGRPDLRFENPRRRSAMTLALAAGLFGLALVDSTSIGTLFIPVWLLLTPGKVRAGRFAVYLGTIVVFYFVVGVILALGAYVAFEQLATVMSDDNDNPWLRVPQMILGVALFLWSMHLGSKKHRAKKEQGRRGSISAWRERAMSGTGNAGALAGLAVVAAGIELLSMVPYLAAIGLMTAAGLGVV